MKLFVRWLNADNLRPPEHYRWIRLIPLKEHVNCQTLYNAVIVGEAFSGTNSKHALYYLLTDDPNYPPGPDLHGGETYSFALVDSGPPESYQFEPFTLEVDPSRLNTFNRCFAREKIKSEKIKRQIDNGYTGRKVVGAPRTELRQPFAWLSKQWKKISRRKPK